MSGLLTLIGQLQQATGPDVTAPTLQSATIESNGSTWTIVFDETVNIGAGGNGGWAVTMTTAGAVTLTYASGDGSNTLVYTGGTTVDSGDTVSNGLDYTQPGNGIEDNAGNDLASISGFAVTNNSSQGATVPTISNAVTDEFDTPSVDPYTVASSSNKLMYVFAQETGSPNNYTTGVEWNTSEALTEVTGSPSTSLNGTSQSIDCGYLDSPTATTATITGDSAEPSSIPGAYEITGAASGSPTLLAEYVADTSGTTAVLSSVVPNSAASLLVAHCTNGSGTDQTVSGIADTLSGVWTGQSEQAANSSVLTIMSSPAGSTSSRDITVTWNSSITRPVVQILEFQPA